MVGKGITLKEQKRELLLHTAGLEVQEIYFTLVSEDQEKDFECTMKVLDDYSIPKANIPFESHLFRQIVQNGEETMDQFVCCLRQRASICDFGDREDEYIRDQVIDKCHIQKLRPQFLEKDGSVTLHDLLVIARDYEAVNAQLKTMGRMKAPDQVKNVSEGRPSHQKRNNGARGPSGNKRECYNSGRLGHWAKDKQCPAKKCGRCEETGHFEIKCPKKKPSGTQRRQGTSHHGSRMTQEPTREEAIPTPIMLRLTM